MRISHISFSKTGGAGIVAHILSETQKNQGINSDFQYVIESSLFEKPFSSPSHLLTAALDHYLVTKRHEVSMFSYLRRNQMHKNLVLHNSPLLHLHWIEGVLPLEQLQMLIAEDFSAVWTIHDMAPMTGGCHHSFECNGFQTSCADCPSVRPFFQKSIEARFDKKTKILLPTNKLKVVAPSKWLAKKAKQSRVFSDIDVTVIENPISLVFFKEFDKNQLRSEIGIPNDSFVVAMSAAQLENPIKQIRFLLDILNELTFPDKSNLRILLIGNGGERLTKDFPNTIVVGGGDSSHVAMNLAMCDLLVVGSKAESAGMSIREAGALGVPTVVISNGGSDEMIVQGETGFVVENAEELREVVQLLMKDRKKLSQLAINAQSLAKARAFPINVSGEYLKLYNLLNNYSR